MRKRRQIRIPVPLISPIESATEAFRYETGRHREFGKQFAIFPVGNQVALRLSERSSSVEKR